MTKRYITLETVPDSLLDGLPAADQTAIRNSLGKPMELVGYDDRGFMELEFRYEGDIHTIWVEPKQPLPQRLSREELGRWIEQKFYKDTSTPLLNEAKAKQARFAQQISDEAKAKQAWFAQQANALRWYHWRWWLAKWQFWRL